MKANEEINENIVSIERLAKKWNMYSLNRGITEGVKNEIRGEKSCYTSAREDIRYYEKLKIKFDKWAKDNVPENIRENVWDCYKRDQNCKVVPNTNSQTL